VRLQGFGYTCVSVGTRISQTTADRHRNAAFPNIHERLFNWLLKNGANPNIPDVSGTTLMYYVARRGSNSLMQQLLASGAGLDSISIFAAIRRDNADSENIPILRLLLSNGVDVNFLHLVERHPSSSALRANIVYRYTPLFEAVRVKGVEAVDLLIKNGADVNLRVRQGSVERSPPLEAMPTLKSEELKQMGTEIQQDQK
jgi:ankyrin repeat protein